MAVERKAEDQRRHPSRYTSRSPERMFLGGADRLVTFERGRKREYESKFAAIDPVFVNFHAQDALLGDDVDGSEAVRVDWDLGHKG